VNYANELITPVLNTGQLTHATEQDPSWAANTSTASQKFPAFYANRKFITVLTKTHHLSLSSARLIESSTRSHFLKTHSDIIHPRMPRSSKLSLSLGCPPPKPCMHLSSPTHLPHIPPSSFFFILSPKEYYWGVQIIQLLTAQSLPVPCRLHRLRPEYLPRYDVLWKPQPIFLPQCKRPRFIPIQNNTQNCSCVYFNIHFFR